MRIGLNLLFLIPSEVGGTETYSTSLIRAIHKRDHVNEYFLFINREAKSLDLPDGGNFHIILCPIRASNRAIRFLWEQLVLPWQAAALKLDLLHSLGYISPLVLPCRSVVTIHDLNFLHVPESSSRFTTLVQKYFVTWTAIRADGIIVVSEFVRKQLGAYLKGVDAKVHVIHEASKEIVNKNPDPAMWNALKEKYGLNKPYIFAYSSLTPHKNMPRLIEAYAKLRKEGADCQLLIVGHQPVRGPSLIGTTNSLGLDQNEVIFTGFLPEDEIFILLSHARVFAFPSLYEGFGLPVLEAMAAGTAVACSSAGSIREIAGEAAFFFDPSQVDQIVFALRSLLENEPRRQELIERGRQNLKRFSWDKTAMDTLKVYNEQLFTEKRT